MNNKKIIWVVVIALSIIIIKRNYIRNRIVPYIESAKLFAEKMTFAFEKLTDPEINPAAQKKFYVINLKTSTLKMESVKRQSDKYHLNIERFDAVNGYKIVLVDTITKNVIEGSEIKSRPELLETNREYLVYCNPESYKQNSKPDIVYLHGNGEPTGGRYSPILSAGELGIKCSSHILWNQIANSKEDQIAVIFEDDIVLSDNFDKKIQDIFDHLPKKWDLIYIDYAFYEDLGPWRATLKKATERLLKHDGKNGTWGGHAYIINKNSAKKLLEIQDKYGNIVLDAIFVEGARSSKLDVYILSEKIADVNTGLQSDITNMGRK